MASTRSVTFDIFARDRASSTFNDIGNSAERSESKLSKFGAGAAKFAKFAAVGLLAAGAAAAKFGFDAIGAASDLNETLNKSAAIFGKQAPAMEKWAAGAATAVGLSKNAALGAAAGFGDMFTQIGYTRGIAAAMSRDAVQLSADLGSFSNLDTADVAERMSAAFRGEYDSLQQVIPNINAARVESEALATTGKKTAASLTAQDKAYAVMAIVHRDGAKAMGDFSKTSGSLANQQKILGAQFENIKASVGQKLLPVMVKLATFTTSKIMPALANFGGQAREIGATISAKVGPTLQRLGDMFHGQILPAITSLGNYLNATFVPVFRQVGEIISTRVAPIVSSFASFLVTQLWPALFKIYTQVAKNLKPVFDQLAATYRTQILPTVDKVLKKFHEWQPTIQKVILIVAKLVGKFMVFQSAVLAKVLPVLIKLAGFLIKNMVEANLKVIGIVVKVIAKMIHFGTAVYNAGVKVGEFVSKVREKMGNFVANVKDAAGKAVEWVRGIPDKLVALKDKFGSAGKSLIKAFVDGMKNAAGIVSGIAGNVWNAVRGLLNGAIDRINSALDFTISLPGPDLHVNTPDIPHLATGTGFHRGGLAVVGEQGPELVSLPRGSRVYPNQTLARGSRGGGAGTETIVLKVYLDSKEIQRSLIKRKREIGKNLGLA